MPGSFFGSGAVSSVAGRSGTVVLTKSDVGLGNLTNAAQVLRTEMGVASGVATLDSSGKLDSAQLPTIAVSEFLGEVADETAMLALDGSQGSWCSRTDRGTIWVLIGDDPTDVSDWNELAYPTAPVLSVSGKTGSVSLTFSDLSGNVATAQFNGGTAATAGTFWRGDGTWATPQSDIAAASLWTTKGDMAIATGNSAATRLAVGANGAVLLSDSAATSGVKWGPLPISSIENYATSTLALADPGADRIAFWDESGNVFNWLTPGGFLEVSGTTLGARTTAHRGKSKEIWLAIRSDPDNAAGTGTQEDPFDASTSTKLDAIFTSYAATTDICFQFVGGRGAVFKTSPKHTWRMKNGWRFELNGATLQNDGAVSIATGQVVPIIYTAPGVDTANYVTVRNGKLDVNWPELALTAPVGSGARTFTDGQTFSGAATIISPANAVFTVADLFRGVSGTGIPAATYILRLPETTYNSTTFDLATNPGSYTVVSTADFAASGKFFIESDTTRFNVVTYTSKTLTTFLGCSTSGTGAVLPEAAITTEFQAVMSANATASGSSISVTIAGEKNTVASAWYLVGSHNRLDNLEVTSPYGSYANGHEMFACGFASQWPTTARGVDNIATRITVKNPYGNWGAPFALHQVENSGFDNCYVYGLNNGRNVGFNTGGVNAAGVKNSYVRNSHFYDCAGIWYLDTLESVGCTVDGNEAVRVGAGIVHSTGTVSWDGVNNSYTNNKILLQNRINGGDALGIKLDDPDSIGITHTRVKIAHNEIRWSPTGRETYSNPKSVVLTNLVDSVVEHNTFDPALGGYNVTPTNVACRANHNWDGSALTMYGGTLADNDAGSFNDVTITGSAAVSGAFLQDGETYYQISLRDTALYNASPKSGLVVRGKFNSAGDYAGLGGFTIGKDNATNGNVDSFFALATRSGTGGVGITEKMRVCPTGGVHIGGTTDAGPGNLRLAGLTASQFIATNSSKTLISKSIATVRSDLSLAATDSPLFAGLNIGAASGSQLLNIKRAGGTSNTELGFQDQLGAIVATFGVEAAVTNDLMVASKGDVRFYTEESSLGASVPSNERMRLQVGLHVGGTTDPGAGNVRLAGLTASQFVETDASKTLVSKTAAQMRTDLAVAHLVAVPSTASSTGVVGDWAFDGTFIYVCPTTNTWFRAAVATWP